MNVIELPTAAKPVEPVLDPEVLARILTLHNYGNARGFINEAWATGEFKRTYELAYSMCKDEVTSTMGFTISYSPSRGDHIHAMYDSGYSSNRFHRNLPLAGELAQVFEEELHTLAMVRAVVDQKRDEDELLRQRAQQRLNLVLAHGIRLPAHEGEGG